jgi:hypothetical protein
LDPTQLRRLLKARGAFPDKQRGIIWKSLLDLPYNHKAYECLSIQGDHAMYADLAKVFPLHSGRSVQRLQRTLSALAHWSPLFAEVPYLPALLFPFVKLFGRDAVLCFEMCAAVLVHWCKGWFDYFPNVPVAIMARLTDALAYVDSELFAHLSAVNDGPREGLTVVVWPLLQTLMTEVLHKDAWLKLWDHLVAFWDEPDLLFGVVLAFLVILRGQLLAIPPSQVSAFQDLLRQPHTIDIRRLLDMAKNMRAQSPGLSAASPSPVAELLNPSASGVFGEQAGRSASLPFPKTDSYPVFTAYPRFIVDWRAKEKERVTNAQKQLLSHQDQLNQVESATKRLREQEAAFRAQQAELLRAEEQRRQYSKESWKDMVASRKLIEEQSFARRVEHIQQMQDAMTVALEQQQKRQTLETLAAQEDMNQAAMEREMDIESRLKQEAILALESETNMKLFEVAAQQRREDSAKLTRTEVESRVKELNMRDELQQAAWKIEDERDRVVLEHERATLIAKGEAERQATEKRRLELDLRVVELKRQQELAKIARERTLRKAAHEATMRSLAQQAALARRLDQAADEDNLEMQRQVQGQVRKEETWRKERDELLQRELSKHQLEVERNIERSWDVEADATRREFDVKLREQVDESAEDIARREKEVVRTLLQMDEDRRHGRAADALVREQEALRRAEADAFAYRRMDPTDVSAAAQRSASRASETRVGFERAAEDELSSLRAELQRDSSVSSGAPSDGGKD